MSRLTIVRHGQANFFAEDYDKLSEIGEQQSRVLAEYWIAHGVAYDEVYTGTLQRQSRTAEVVGETFAAAGLPWPEHGVYEGLNEYEADVVMDKLLPELCEREDRFRVLKEEYEAAEAEGGPPRYRTFHRLLEAVMAEYVAGKYESNGFESWTAFSGRVRDALKAIVEKGGSGRSVAVFRPGAP